MSPADLAGPEPEAVAGTDATLAVHAARLLGDGRARGVPVSEPIVQTANFLLDEASVADLASSGGARTYSYTRLANPTIESAARVVAALEGAEDAVVTSSGMAAITASLLALTPPGGRILTVHEIHGESSYLMRAHLEPLGFQVTSVPLAALGRPEGFADQAPDVVYVETLSNPMLRVADVAAIEATMASPLPSIRESTIVSQRRAWIVHPTCNSSQTARAISTLKPASEPSARAKLSGG